MNSFLSNMRWLCLPSENLGQDWFTKSLQIDSVLTAQGLDLSEESTYLLFSEAPDKVLDGEGQCLIARPVIGPKKAVDAPWMLIDWKAAPVWQQKLQGESFNEILSQALEAKEGAFKEQSRLAGPFSLCVQRKLGPELKLSIEVIFHE